MSERSVLMALTPTHPVIEVVVGHPVGAVRVGGRDYVETCLSAEPFLGFYDWLRTTTGAFVGFRLTIGHGSEALAALVPERPYVVRDGANIFSVFFRSPDADIDEEGSTEQDFGASRAFVSSEGDLLLAVDANSLSAEELAAATRIDVTR